MCYETINEECSKLGHKQIQRDYAATTQCVLSTFEDGDTTRDNRVLKEDAQQWRTLGAGYWPSIVINNRTYRGDLVPDSVFNAICAGYTTEPAACKKFKIEASMPPETDGITGSVLMAVVVMLVLVNVALICLYRRCTQKELKQNMPMQVNSAVSQYFALSQNKSMQI